MMTRLICCLIVFLAITPILRAGGNSWYTEGSFAPGKRLEITLVNTLDVERKKVPVSITRDAFPVKKLHEMWVTVVDPSLPPKAEPSPEEFAFAGMSGIRCIVYQRAD